ncbi:MAG: HPr family phosphocarrier protein [Candidatus Fermentibacteraceae bacterium]|nr:HPr family phosphocarrier protein [Candidatus Fermentibacteraceae bacterium]MBN2607638.1 HPr family phosphocarrier protein [Candidatus Fermentibacteraceae bacterium]
MKTDRAEVVNKLGIHARPAAQIVKTASLFDSIVNLTVEGITVNAKSIMGVMTLAACRGSVIQVEAEGEDEDAAVLSIIELIGNGFGEE